MEGSTAAVVRRLGVEQRFECSRLEKALLAQAYQRIVPGVRQRIGPREAETHAATQPGGTDAGTCQGRVIT
jgi:hypothetical protein